MSRFGVDIKGSAGLKRDIKTGAIVQTDKSGYRNFMKHYQVKENQINTINELKAGYKDLSEKVDLILKLVKEKL